MGCAGSKLDDLQAVALCRERSNLLEAAIRHRYSLAQAYLSYLRSLKSVALSLERYFYIDPSTSPFLPLPTPKKGDPDPNLVKLSSSSPPIPTAHLSRSDSGSHLRFNSDSDSDASGSPLHDPDDEHGSPRQTRDPMPTHYYTNYVRSAGPMPSISYEQRPLSPEAVRLEGYYSKPSTSYSYSSYSDPHPSFAGAGGFFGSPPPPESPSPSVAAAPPPSPPQVSTWEFLNPFEASENYYLSYTPGRNSKEMREEGGIPELEEEYHRQEDVKVADGGAGGGHSKVGVGGKVGEIGGKASTAGEEQAVEYEVHVVEKKVVVNDELGNVAPAKVAGLRDFSEAVAKIKEQFDRASDAGVEVAKILEVGKLPYRGRNAVYKVSSRMLEAIAPLPVESSSPFKFDVALPSAENVDSLSLGFEDDMKLNSKSLSSALDKLFIWEKKLCEEVKAEEKMRIIHERKSRRLKHLDESGAEAPKIESTRILVRELSTKIRISLQFVESISNTINSLRDDDLWPQIDELIQGFVKMWKVMLECHQSQCQILSEAGDVNNVASSGKLSDTHMEATMQLEQEILNWILSFYAWISALKSFVKTLNGWLLMCIHYEPEETADGVAPFSPGRIGAPPVFVICNHWSQVMDRISEKEVFEAMRSFSASVLQIWDRYYLEQRQRMMANKDMEKKFKFLEGEEQKMQKSLDMVNKKLTLVSEQNGLPPPGQIMRQSHSSSASDSDNSLVSGLKQIFEALERFSDICLKTYEELSFHSDECKVARQNAKVP